MASRDLNQLQEPFQTAVRELLKRAKAQGIPFLVTETTRTLAEQKENVRKGVSRTLNSRHLIGEAVDIAFTVGGRLSYDPKLYERMYEIVKVLDWIIWPHIDLKWKEAGFVDMPHYQYSETKSSTPSVSCEAEKEEIRKLNTEIGVVTQARDNCQNILAVEKHGHKETLEKLTAEQKKREVAEDDVRMWHRRYEQLRDNKFDSIGIIEKIRILIG